MNEDASGRDKDRGRRVEAHEDVNRWNGMQCKTDRGKRKCGLRGLICQTFGGVDDQFVLLLTSWSLGLLNHILLGFLHD